MGRSFGIGVLALIFVSGCAATGAPAATSSSSAPATFQITGSIWLPAGGFTYDETSCAGDDGYGDMHVGTQVTVTDQAQAVIAVGSIHASSPTLESNGLASGCTMRFQVPDVPAGKAFYGVEVSHRGRLQYTEEQARADLSLTLE